MFARGFSLIELMLSITMAMGLLVLLTEIYLGSEQAHDVQMAVHGLEDDARLIAEILREDIHLAGYMGCSPLVEKYPVLENQGLIVRHASLEVLRFEKNNRRSVVLYASGRMKLLPGDRLLISDCKNSDIVMVKNAESIGNGIQKIIMQKSLDYAYPRNAEVRRLEENYYFVANNALYIKKRCPDCHPEERFLRRRISLPKEELISGVNEMKIDIQGKLVTVQLNFITNNKLLSPKKWFIDAAIR